MATEPSREPSMRNLLSIFAIGLLGAATVAQAQTPTPAIATSVPAPATSRAIPDQPSLEDIRNFTRVYEIIRQAYVKKTDNKTLLNAAITGMLDKLDPHSAYLDRDGMQQLSEDTSGEYSGLGVVVTSLKGKLIVVSPIDDTPAAKAGLKSGDVIIKIDGKLVTRANVNASVDKLRGKPGTQISMTLLPTDSNKPVTKTLTRELISMTSVRLRTLEPGYAYIRISQFQQDTATQLHHALGDWIDQHGLPKGVVLDLRSNPGGLVKAAVGVADTFLNDGSIVSTRGRVQGSNMRFTAHPGDMLKGSPMVVLVNHGTASAAEILSGALKDNHRALIMGRRTFGKGVVQTVIPIDSDHMLKLTTARYFTPDGASIQAEGITPDITIPDLVAQKDTTRPTLIESESDLPHHLDNSDPNGTQATIAASEHALANSATLAEHDYALAQAINVLKGMALAKPVATAAKPSGGHSE